MLYVKKKIEKKINADGFDIPTYVAGILFLQNKKSDFPLPWNMHKHGNSKILLLHGAFKDAAGENSDTFKSWKWHLQ